MSSITDLKGQLSELTTMKFIAQAFTEASATKIKNIRTQFEKNRQFYEEISHLYHLVTTNAKRTKISNSSKKKSKLDAPIQHKTIFVALTSNQRFYGNLNTNIMSAFLSNPDFNTSDIAIIGTTGTEYMKTYAPKRNYKKIIFSSDNPTHNDMDEFLSNIGNYESIVIYYPKYLTLLTQGIGIVDITQKSELKAEEKNKTPDVQIIFEPELEKILDFFEHQVRLILFTRVLFEADLARTSARLVAMSYGEDRANNLIHEKTVEYRKAISTVINKELLETFTGLKKWKKE